MGNQEVGAVLLAKIEMPQVGYENIRKDFFFEN